MSRATPWEVRQALKKRVAGLTPSIDYRLTEHDAWRLSVSPMVEGEANGRSQLAFWVDDSDVEQRDLSRNNPREGSLIETPIDVVFLYRFVARGEETNWDGSTKAAAALIKHVIDWDPCNEPPVAGEPTVEADFRLRSVIQREVLDEDWVRCVVGFDAVYYLDLATTS